MTARKDIKRIIIPPKFAAQFEASKAQTEQDIMTPLTDAQHAVRLICWALAQREIVISRLSALEQPEPEHGGSNPGPRPFLDLAGLKK